MKIVSREAVTRIEGANVVLGSYDAIEFETAEEAIEKFGMNTVVGMINTTYGNDLGRVARAAFQKDGCTSESVQSAVDSYVPGQRKTKPSAAKLMELVGELAGAGKVDAVQEVIRLNKEEGLDAAFNYALENK